MSDINLHVGDCLDVLRSYPDNSIDSCVTDPPYGLSFMGKKWDYDVPSADIWREVFRVLKPGGYLLAFAGTRTQHRMAVNIEDAGFEIRDMIAWMYGQGFPKSHNVALGIDKMFGHGERGHRIAVANRCHPDGTVEPNGENIPAYEGKCEQSKPWVGWGNNLKPAMEPITVARKPLEGTIAANVLEHGTGAINIDGCRIDYQSDADKASATPQGACTAKSGALAGKTQHEGDRTEFDRPEQKGRFPANVIMDEEAGKILDEQSGVSTSAGGRTANISKTSKIYGGGKGLGQDIDAEAVKGDPGFGDTGGASRFFYCPKTNKKDRGEGNNHPTVKPTDLMRYLCRLVTPPEGIVLDPFMGSGSTGKAALLEGFAFIGIDREQQYVDIARGRIKA